jgi:hypothetical protein
VLAFLLLFCSSGAHAGIPAGADIDAAVSTDVSPEGFQAIAELLPGFLPTSLPVGDVNLYGDECWLVGGYTYGVTVSGLEVFIDVPNNGIQITPMDDGVVWVDINVDVSVNSAGSPFDLHTELLCVGDDCTSWVDPFTVAARTGLHLSMVDDGTGTGNEILDIVIMDPITGDEIYLDTSDLTADKFALNGCSIATINDILGWFGTSIVDLLLPALTGPLNDAVADLDLSSLTAGLGEQLVIEQQLDLEGAILDLKIAPTDTVTTSEGLRLVLGGHASTPASHECIAPFDPGESLETATDIPAVGHLPVAVPEMYHVGLTIADDFVNQLLYSVWQTGLLCQELGGEGAALDIPIPLDTSLLPLLFGDVFDDMFEGDPQPILIRTRPETPPVLALAQDDIAFAMDDFALEVFAEIDGRQAKLVDVGLNVDAGLDLGFNPSLGTLDIGIDLAGAIDAVTNQNEFKPERSDDIAEGVKGLLDQPLIAGIIDGLLSDMVIGLPPIAVPDLDGDGAADSFGVQDMVLTTAEDPDNDWLGAYVWVGQVYYEDAGCGGGCGDCGGGGCDEGLGCTEGCAGDEEGGCLDLSEGCGDAADPTSGCDLSGGCNVSPAVPARTMAVLTVLMIVGLRRRRSD